MCKIIYTNDMVVYTYKAIYINIFGLMKFYLISWSLNESSSSLIADHLFLKLFAHDTVDINRYFNNINNKSVQASTKQHQTTIRPTGPIF